MGRRLGFGPRVRVRTGMELIEVGVNVIASREKESFRNFRVSTRSGPVLPYLCFDNNTTKVWSRRHHRFCHAGVGHRQSFRTFAEKSFHFSFVSPGFGLESITHAYLKFWVNLILLDAIAPKISGLTSSRNFSSRKGHDLWLLTSKHPLRNLDLRLFFHENLLGSTEITTSFSFSSSEIALILRVGKGVLDV